MLGKALDVKCNYFYRLLDNETIFERYNFESSTADSTVINVWTSYTLLSMCEHLTHYSFIMWTQFTNSETNALWEFFVFHLYTKVLNNVASLVNALLLRQTHLKLWCVYGDKNSHNALVSDIVNFSSLIYHIHYLHTIYRHDHFINSLENIIIKHQIC
jgi:hypothetical protein